MDNEQNFKAEIDRLKARIFDTQENANRQINELNGTLQYILKELGFDTNENLTLDKVTQRIKDLVALEAEEETPKKPTKKVK